MSSMATASVASQQATGAVQQHHHHGGHRKQMLDSVSKTLGMSTGDVQSALKNGTSLSQLATQQGVSQDDLLGSIEQGLGGGSISAQTAQRIANRVPDQGDGRQQQPPQSVGWAPADGSTVDVLA